MEGDEKGEYTFTRAKGYRVIEHVIGDSEVREEVKIIKVGDKVDSDHQPIEVEIKGNREKR